jgi:hypothetical protein
MPAVSAPLAVRGRSLDGRVPGNEPATLLATLRDDPVARLRSGRELARRRGERPPAEPLPTGLAALDRLLDGGLPRGRLVELVGRRSSGRFATVLATLAAATTRGQAAALVDLDSGLEPVTVAAAGASLERLLWVRPESLRQAALVTEMLLATGFPLVVLDLGSPPVPGGRGPQAVWMRLARATLDRGAALLVTSPYRASGAAATVVLAAGRARPIWDGRGRAPRLLTGLHSRLTLEKRRDGQRSRPAETLTLRATTTTDDPVSTTPAAITFTRP